MSEWIVANLFGIFAAIVGAATAFRNIKTEQAEMRVRLEALESQSSTVIKNAIRLGDTEHKVTELRAIIPSVESLRENLTKIRVNVARIEQRVDHISEHK